MAKTLAQSNAIYYPQDVAIDELSITTNSGSKYELKYLMVDMSIYEDIYSFSMSGYILLKDSVGLVEKMKLSGFETITIAFGKSNAYGDAPLKFKLHSIPKRKPVGNLSTEYLKLNFCSEELITSEQTKFTKSYKGMQISDMVDDIMAYGLGIPSSKRYIIQPTTGVYDFNIPTIKPFEAISWLSNYARPAANNTKLADMLFFQTKDGFIFKSLSSMYSDPVYATYKYQQQNITSSTEPMSEDVISILDYEFVKTFDVLNGINAGSYANKLISLDPLTRTACTTTFNHDTDISLTLNPGNPLVTTKNPLNLTQNMAYNSRIKMSVTNANQSKKSGVSQGSVSHDIFLETFVPNRTAQLSLANYTVVKIKIPGDSFITVGKVVVFNLPSLNAGTKDLDKFYSGKYLVTAVRHIVQSPGIYQTVLELAKDSNAQSY